MSFSEEQIWIADRLGKSGEYTIVFALRLDGPLDACVVEDVLNDCIQRHESLRTAFVDVGGEPRAVIAANVTLKLSTDRVSTEGRALSEVRRTARLSIPVDEAPLLRARLLAVDDKLHFLALFIHHIICDGLSLAILEDEFVEGYRARSGRQSLPLKGLTPAVDYRALAVQQRRRAENAMRSRAFEEIYAELVRAEPLELPLDDRRPEDLHSRAGSVRVTVPTPVADRLRALAREERVTPFMVFVAIAYTLLARYTGQTRLTVGCPITTRPRGCDHVVGLFANLLVLQGDVSDGPSTRELANRVRRQTLKRFSLLRHIPFDLVTAGSPLVERGSDRRPTVNVLVTSDTRTREARTADGITVTRLDIPPVATRYDLELAMVETDNDLSFTIVYRRRSVRVSTAERMARHLRQLVTEATTRSGASISSLSLSNARERRELMAFSTAGGPPLSSDETMVDLLSKAFAKFGAAPAVRSEGSAMSYAELDHAANALAADLRGRGVGPEVVVASRLPRGAAVPVALLGTLKAGGAYLPIAHDTPRARFDYMLRDSGAQVLVETTFDGTLRVKTLHQRPTATGQLKPCSTAYLIYTSGSTGKPKASANTHIGLANAVRVHASIFGAQPGDGVLGFTSPAFDASVWEICASLHEGAQLVIPREGSLIRDSPELAAHVSVAFLTPALLTELDPSEIPNLRTLISGGDRCDGSIVRRWADHCRLFNLYGPSETAVFVTTGEMTAADRIITIGRPISGVRITILDRTLRPVPVGVSGEIYIAGVHVGQGYIGQARLTADRFVPDPCGLGTRMYASGDRGRWLPDGRVEFVGRDDDQIKIRGYRVERSEVESVIRRVTDGADVFVALDTRGHGARLIAFIAGLPAVDRHALRAALALELPPYMIPSRLISVRRLPLTATGKIDREKLLALYASRSSEHQGAAGPRGEVEEAVISVWSELLVARAGPETSFFAEGGDSLLAMRMISQLATRLQKTIPLPLIFEHPNLRDFSRAVETCVELTSTSLGE